jgi:serine protease Do
MLRDIGGQMVRVLISTLIAFIAGTIVTSQVSARVMDGGDADVVRQTMPAVVNLTVWKVHPGAKLGEAPRRVSNYGSGFIVDPAGIIVTNKHVIDGAIDIMVTFSDRNRAHAKLLATAVMTDLAVLKVDVGHTLPVLKWANSGDLRVGDAVLTFGNPQGIGLSVSAGIVSALNRNLHDTPFDRYIQTDAAINRGTSGGPLVNRDGEVVGVDTALYNTDPKGGFIGIGFAIPAGAAKFVVGRMLDPSHPKAGWIGVTLQDITPELVEALGLPGPRGAIIAAVDPEGPADRASLQSGDVLTGIGDEMAGDSRAIMRAIVSLPIGQPVRLKIWRDGKEQQVAATVAEWPYHPPDSDTMSASLAKAMIQKPPDTGMSLVPLTDAGRKHYGLDPKLNGVLVAAVERDCEARDLGVVPGDVITKVQGVPMASPAQVEHALVTAYGQHRAFIAMLLQGKGGTRWVTLSMGSTGP